MNNYGNPDYYLDFTPLLENSNLSELALKLSVQRSIVSQKSFRSFCERVCFFWPKEVSASGLGNGILFHDRYRDFECLSDPNLGSDSVRPTAWGGVIITRLTLPYVEKYLIVDPGYYLALEKHSEKVEILTVKEGRGIILKRQGASNVLEVVEAEPGSTHYFTPGLEHCVISTEGLVIYERSIDPKGMDQDLIFIYPPEA